MQPSRLPIKLFATIFFSAMFFSTAVSAQMENYAHGEIITGDKNDAALVLTLEDGWYTYWRMAGDSGLPPKMDWSNSKNLSSVDVVWPIPSRYTAMDMHSFGYKNQVVFPLNVSATDDTKPVELSLSADLIICKDICIPQKIEVTQDLSAARRDSASIEAAQKQIPLKENAKDLGLDTAVLSKEALVIAATAADGFESGADLIVETNPPLLFAPPEIIPDTTDKTRAVLKIKAPAGMDLSKELFGKKANLLLIHSGKSVEKEFSF